MNIWTVFSRKPYFCLPRPFYGFLPQPYLWPIPFEIQSIEFGGYVSQLHPIDHGKSYSFFGHQGSVIINGRQQGKAKVTEAAKVWFDEQVNFATAELGNRRWFTLAVGDEVVRTAIYDPVSSEQILADIKSLIRKMT